MRERVLGFMVFFMLEGVVVPSHRNFVESLTAHTYNA